LQNGLSGRLVSHPEEEQILFTWIVEKRSKEIFTLTFDDIKDKMISLSPRFKASYSWLKGFLRRFGLSLRKICCSSSSLSQEQVKRQNGVFKRFHEES
jgi:hypothetical protein